MLASVLQAASVDLGSTHERPERRKFNEHGYLCFLCLLVSFFFVSRGAGGDRGRRDYPPNLCPRGSLGSRKTNPVVDGQLVPKPPGPHNKKRRREEPAAAAPSTCPICLEPTTTKLACGHAMCEECMGRLAVFQGQTLTRSRRRVVIQCPLRCQASTERVLA